MVDVSDIHDNVTRATLTPAGMLSLAEEGHFIDISDQDIQDKSKADVLAKSLTVLQVTWICLQCISRKAAGFPLTPLEIHTLVHSACALFMFALWFRKPLDVRVPTLATGEAGFFDMVALFLMRSPALGVTPYDILDPPKEYEPLPHMTRFSDHLWLHKRLIRVRRSEASYLLFDANSRDKAAVSRPLETYLSSTVNSTQDVPHESIEQDRQFVPRFSCRHSNNFNTLCVLVSGEFTFLGIGPSVLPTGHSKADLERSSTPENAVDRIKSNAKGPNIMEVPNALRRLIPIAAADSKYIQHWHMIELFLNEKDILRWGRASKALEQEDIHVCDYSFNTNKRFAKYETLVRGTTNGRYRSMEAVFDAREREAKDLLCSRAQNVFLVDVLRLFSDEPSAGYYVRGMMMVLSALYGGVHLSLWNYEFPTRAEGLMWKISAITLGSLPGFYGVMELALEGFISFLWIGVLLEPYQRRIWSPMMRLRRRRSPDDLTERQRSRLMAFDAKDSDYPSLISSTFLWLRQQLPNACWSLLAISRSSLWAAFFCLPILYLLSRIFIVVESFISLRHVPVGVYVGVGWTKYIPHL